MDKIVYEPNSYKYKERVRSESNETKEEKKIEKVTTGEVKTKKKSAFSEDIASVKDYVVKDVLIPSGKNVLSDIANGILDAIGDAIGAVLFGGKGGGRRRRGSISSKVDYRTFFDSGRRDDRRPVDNNRTKSGYSYEDIIVETRTEAEEVILRMEEIIDTYGQVSVADLYDLVGVSSNYTDNNYGWKNVHTAEPYRVRDGFMIRLPRVLPLN